MDRNAASLRSGPGRVYGSVSVRRTQKRIKTAIHSPSRCMQRRGEERAHHRHHDPPSATHAPELIIRMSSSPEGSNRRSARVRRDV